MKDLSNREITEYFKILWNRRWYFLIIFVLISTGTAVYAFRQPDVYKSEAKVMVDYSLVPMAAQESASDRINSIREMLASRTFLELIIQQFTMYGYGSEGFVMESAVKAAQRQIGVTRTSERTFTISFIASSPQQAQSITKQLTQELIRVSDRAKVDKIRVADQFVDERLEEAAKKLREQNEQIAHFRRMHMGELPSEGGVNSTLLNGLHTQLTSIDANIQRIFDSQKTLDFRYQESKRQQEARERDRQAMLAMGVPVDTPERKMTPDELELNRKEKELTQRNEQLIQMQAKYTENHPDVVIVKNEIASLQKEIANKRESMGLARAQSDLENTTVANGAKNQGASQTEFFSDADSLENQYNFHLAALADDLKKQQKAREELQRKIQLFEARLQASPMLEGELDALQRERTKLQERYDQLAGQKYKTEMASSVTADKNNETYRIMDDANLPIRPVSPNRNQTIAVGLIVGFIGGLLGAFGRELLDGTVGSEEEAKKIFNLPTLVAIPAVTDKTTKKKSAA